jgi:Tfp pilus assembly protein PilF
VLEKAGKRTDARQEYERSLALDPQLTVARDALKALR